MNCDEEKRYLHELTKNAPHLAVTAKWGGRVGVTFRFLQFTFPFSSFKTPDAVHTDYQISESPAILQYCTFLVCGVFH
jgi:hypothetical protein